MPVSYTHLDVYKRQVCVPGKNEKDIEELSAEIKKDLEIVYADTIEDILKVAFVKE